MNGTMPAITNISAGSSLTSGAEGTIVCPFFSK